jgi:hypothetical protein
MKIEKEKGVSLIITFFIMMIVLIIVLSISVLLYSGIKVIRNMGNSVISYYAAESGVEKVLYYDRQVVLEDAERGLCAMLDNCTTGTGTEKSIYCTVTSPNAGTDCVSTSCNNCSFTFTTVLDDKSYKTTASVVSGSYHLDIKSTGIFSGTSRQIDTQQESE